MSNPDGSFSGIDSYSPLVELTRNGLTESTHYGAFAIMDSQGRLIASHGDPNLIAFPRSSEKPFQALPFLEIEGDRHFGLSQEETAILCASHSGSDRHVAVVTGLQQRTGVTEQELRCGTHPPADPAAQKHLEATHTQPTPNRNNCSGKHTGMILHARLRGFPTKDYIDPSHPLQQIILESIVERCEVAKDQVITGIDGCSAPNFAVPLSRFATAYARLMDPKTEAKPLQGACERIVHAMVQHPEMVGGPNLFDTVLMKVGKGKIISKGGAEGYHAIGIAPGILGMGSPGIGIALKVSDGDTPDYQRVMSAQAGTPDAFKLSHHDAHDRARPCAVVELLRQLGIMDDDAMDALKWYAARPIYNWEKLPIGEIRPAFKI